MQNCLQKFHKFFWWFPDKNYLSHGSYTLCKINSLTASWASLLATITTTANLRHLSLSEVRYISVKHRNIYLQLIQIHVSCPCYWRGNMPFLLLSILLTVCKTVYHAKLRQYICQLSCVCVMYWQDGKDGSWSEH